MGKRKKRRRKRSREGERSEEPRLQGGIGKGGEGTRCEEEKAE